MSLNCVLVALWLWWRSRMRTGVGVKRSEGLRGLVPHMFHLQWRGDTRLIVVDYIPRRRKHAFTERGDSFVIFDGMYRARIYRQEAVATSDTLFSAYRDAATQSRANRT